MNTEFMLTIPVDYLIVFAVILACVLGALIACVVMLNAYQKQLEEIFKAVTAILYTVDGSYEKIGDIRNDLNVCHDKLDIIIRSMPPGDEWPEPGEVVELGEVDFVGSICERIAPPEFKKRMETVDDIKEVESEEESSASREFYEKTAKPLAEKFNEGLDLGLKKASDKALNALEDLAKATADALFSETESRYLDEVGEEMDKATYNYSKIRRYVEPVLKDEEVDEDESNRCADELDIHMISREEYLFGGLHEFSKHKLWYDTVKDVLRQTNGLFNSHEFEPATATFLGDGLRFFGVSSENKNVIYIRNHKLKADFMVEKASVIARNGVEN